MSEPPRPRFPMLDDHSRVRTRLAQRVRELESVWREGGLGSLLRDDSLVVDCGEELVAVYRGVAGERTRPTGWRRHGVEQLLSTLGEFLGDAPIAFTAAPHIQQFERDLSIPTEAGEGIGFPSSVRVTTPDATSVTLPLHTVFGTRFWGIRYDFEEPAHQEAYATGVIRLAARKLARDLADLSAIEAWLAAKSKLGRAPELVPERRGLGFERLVRDVLNAPGPYLARPAPLREDFLEKTDLRVRYPDIERRRGVRAQVTLAHHPRSLQQKKHERGCGVDALVSPGSLAEAALDPTPPRLLTHAEREELWSALPAPPSSNEEATRGIKEVFAGLLEGPITDPRGPAALMPRVLAELMRRFVRREAKRGNPR